MNHNPEIAEIPTTQHADVAELTYDSELLDSISELVQQEHYVEAAELLQKVSVTDRALLLSRIAPQLQCSLLSNIDLEQAADLLHEMPEVQAVELLEDMVPSVAADILEELPKDEQADLVGEMPQVSRDAILSEMESLDATAVRELATYEDEEAGGIMGVEFLSIVQHDTVGSVIEHLRSNVEELSDLDVQYAYVVDDQKQLKGVLRLRDLLLSPNETPIADITIADPLFVYTNTPLFELHTIFDKHSFFGLPVVNQQKELVGVLRRGAVEEAMSEQNADDYRKAQGIVSEELRTMPLALRSRRRLAWLSINIVLNIIAASVIALYQETLEQVIALAVFLPIISDMSGCSGNQAVAVSMRELSLGLVNASEVALVWVKEVTVGMINGLVLGSLIAAVAWLWKGNPWLGGVVGLAMMCNTIIAVSLGGTLPLIMRRFNLDPALASGPILTTVTDMCGFFLVLSCATMFLDRLL